MSRAEISRRPVCDADVPFLFELYAGTREAELAQVPWTAGQKLAFARHQFEAQMAGYAASYPGAFHEMICLGDDVVGRVYWAKQPDELHILDITIAPSRRNQGLGTQVIGALLEKTRRTGMRVTIYVESFNPSCRLFQRLGFHVASQEGFLLLLELLPASEINK